MSTIINREAQGTMDALGISEDRCVELCNAIEQTWSEHKDWPYGQVLDEVRKVHCKNDNEFAFVLHVFGRHQGFQEGAAAEHIHTKIKSMFSGLRFGRAHQWEPEHEMSN